MGINAAALLQQILALPEDEREELAYEVLASLREDDAELSEEWKVEIGRRIAEVESGAVVCEDWDVVEKRLLAKYPKA